MVPCRARHAFRLLVLVCSIQLAVGAAVDWLAPLPPQCSEYPDVVARLRELRLYTGPYARYVHHRASDSAGGSKLVLPVEQRRVPVASGYAEHWRYAASRLHEPDFFPIDA